MWFNMLPSDSRDRWPSDVFADARVTQRWDANKLVGTWYATSLGLRDRGVLWDAYLLYGPIATLSAQPSPPVSWGNPIVQTREKLRTDVQALLSR